MTSLTSRATIVALFVLGSFVAITQTPSQGRVWPAGFASSPGGSSMDTPFSVSGLGDADGARCATLMEAASLPFNGGSVIDALAFRRDAVASQTYGSVSGNFELRIGSVANALTPTTAFRDMWEGEPVEAAFGAISLPGASRPSAGPAPFDVVIPFSTPWVYPGGDLGIDIAFRGGPGSIWRRDAIHREPRAEGEAWRVGSGCEGSNGFVPQPWVDVAECVPGGRFVARVQGIPNPAGGPVGLVVGGRRTTSLDLAAFGMPSGCRSYVDPWATYVVVSDQAAVRFASASAALRIPTDSALVGGRLSFEWFVPDVLVGSALPLIMSDAMTAEVGAAGAVGRFGRSIWGHGSSRVGHQYYGRISAPDYVPVTEFRGSFR